MVNDLIPHPDDGSDDEQIHFSFPEPGDYEPGGLWDVQYLPHLPRSQRFWRSQGGCWRPVDMLVLRREFPGSDKDFGQFLENIKNQNYLPPNFAAPPFYLPNSRPPYDETAEPLPPPKIIRCLSGDLDFETEKLRPFDPRNIATAVVPIRLNPSARAPAFVSFISSLVPCVAQRRFLLEFFGLCLINELNSFKKMLCLVGPRDCGKSVLMFVFEQLIGTSNCCHLSNRALASQFGLFNTIGRMVNISNEEAWPTRNECYVIKAVSGGDTLPMEIKHGPIVSIRPTVRLVNVSNDKVHFPDPHMWDRVAIIQCRDSIPRDQQDFGLRKKLVSELPGIFLVLLASVINLYRRGDFQDVPSMRESRDEAMRYSDHLIDFCEECFELQPGNLLDEADIVDAYTHFCRDGNFRANADIGVIKEKLREVYHLDGRRHRQRVGGQRMPAIKGIRLVRYSSRRGRVLGTVVTAEDEARIAKEERFKAEAAARDAKESLAKLREMNRAERKAEVDEKDRERIDEIIDANRQNKKARTDAEKKAKRTAKLAAEAAQEIVNANKRLERALAPPPAVTNDQPRHDEDEDELDVLLRRLGDDDE